MPLNTGETGGAVSSGTGGQVRYAFEYNPVLTGGQVLPENQPLVNRDIGDGLNVCLRVWNNTGKVATLRVDGPSGPFLGTDGTRDVDIPVPADPSVPARTATANQLRTATGMQTRADITNFTMSSP
jgi:hypothetical protein